MILRLLAMLALIVVGVSLVMYVWTRQGQYLRFAWRVLLSALAIGLALVLFYAAERLLMI